jgi:hypothetical protein
MYSLAISSRRRIQKVRCMKHPNYIKSTHFVQLILNYLNMQVCHITSYMPCHITLLKNNFEILNKIYYNPLRVINLSTCSHVTPPHVILDLFIEK